MVTGEEDDSIFVQAAVPERLEKLADAVVNIAYGSVVGTACPLDLLVREILVPKITNFEKPLAVGVLLVIGNPDLGHLNVDILVTVPVLLLNGVRVMGMG